MGLLAARQLALELVDPARRGVHECHGRSRFVAGRLDQRPAGLTLRGLGLVHEVELCDELFDLRPRRDRRTHRQLRHDGDVAEAQ